MNLERAEKPEEGSGGYFVEFVGDPIDNVEDIWNLANTGRCVFDTTCNRIIPAAYIVTRWKINSLFYKKQFLHHYTCPVGGATRAEKKTLTRGLSKKEEREKMGISLDSHFDLL